LELKLAAPGSGSDADIICKVCLRCNKIDLDNPIRFGYPEGRWLCQGGTTISMVEYPNPFIQLFIAA
jgi:hypothetical protein